MKNKTIGVITSNKYIKWDTVLKQGIEQRGYNFRLVTKAHKVHGCSLLWMVGYKQKGHTLKAQCNVIAKKHNIPVIYMDSGAFYDRENLPVNCKHDFERLFGISVDGCKNHGLKYLDYLDIEDGEFERQIQSNTGLEILPTKQVQTNSTVIILLHNVVGCALDFTPVCKQMKACSKLKKDLEQLGYKVITSYHPLHPKDKHLHRDRVANKTKMVSAKSLSLEYIVKESSMCLGWHTNTLCWTCINGIQTVCYDSMNFCYEIVSHDLNDLKCPSIEERYKWANRLAYSQFKLNDIINGKVWERVENYLKAKEDGMI